MSIVTDPAAYAKADPTLLREIVTAAEARLTAQLTASLAADQRALVLAGFLVPTIVALIGAAFALLLQKPSQTILGAIAMFAAVGLFASLILVVHAARPVPWSYPGIRPRAWINDIANKKAEQDRLAELAADAEKRAGENADLMARNGVLVRIALWIAALTLGSGGVMGGWFFLCR